MEQIVEKVKKTKKKHVIDRYKQDSWWDSPRKFISSKVLLYVFIALKFNYFLKVVSLSLASSISSIISMVFL